MKKDYSSESQRYMTPVEMYQPILDFMGIDEFDSDVACENMNIPAKKYFTEDGLYAKNDFFFKLASVDGLTGEWGNGVHFCNPPWKLSRHFVKKIYQEVTANKNSRVWAILPMDRFETAFYQKFIAKNKNCFCVLLPKAGFLIPEAPLDTPKPSGKAMYVYFGQDAKETAASWNEVMDVGVVFYNAFSIDLKERKEN